jgi:DNA-binding CsgD family transcriptional regulator
VAGHGQAVKFSLDTDIGLAERWLTAWDQRDVDELLRIAHPDIEIVPENPLLPLLPGASFRGHVGLRTLALWSYENYPHFRIEDRSLRKVRGVLVASATYVEHDPSKSEIRRPTETVFDVELGLIRRVRSFQPASRALQTALAEPMLTPREREVFQLLARGRTAPEIAAALFISPATVRTHVQNGVGRLGAKTRVEAISIAMKNGEIEP